MQIADSDSISGWTSAISPQLSRVDQGAGVGAEAQRVLVPLVERLRQKGPGVEVATRFDSHRWNPDIRGDQVDLIVVCAYGEEGGDPHICGSTADPVTRRATGVMMQMRPEKVGQGLPLLPGVEEVHL